MFKNDLSMIAGYPEGRILIVTWYSQVNATTHLRSMNMERLTSDSDPTHYSFHQIRNFELRLSNELAFEYDKETNISSMKGDALVLPGFQPLVNDLFLYKLRNGKIGIFIVNSTERTAIGNDTYHRISFDLTSYTTPKFIEQLKSQTSLTSVFDKTKFLVGNHAVFTSDFYTLKQDLTRIRAEIVRTYQDRYYSEDYKSFVRPDGIYDPYMVEYWNRKISYIDCYRRPTQLLISQHAFNRTIWAALTGVPVSVDKLESKYVVRGKGFANWDTNINCLIDRPVLLMGKDITFEADMKHLRKFTSGPYGEYSYSSSARNRLIAKLKKEHNYWYGEPEIDHPHTKDHEENPDPLCKVCHDKYHSLMIKAQQAVDNSGKRYAVSDEFYLGSTAMSTMEQLVYDAVTAKEIDVHRVRDVLDDHYNWDDDIAFYQYLLSIYLIDYSTNWLIHHS